MLNIKLDNGDIVMSFIDDLDSEPSLVDQELANSVDDLLPEEFELYELEGEESVFFSYTDREDEATAEIRYTTPREKGYTEADTGPRYALSITISGPESDEKTTWFSLEEAIDYAVKRIKLVLKES